MTNHRSSGRRSKVARLLDEYGFETLGTELERRWTAEGDQRMSLRDLADYFNQKLLDAALAEAGVHPLAGEVENTYRLLTDEDVPTTHLTRTRRQLAREGVDLEALQSDFVTYQAIRTYLKNVRGAEQPTDSRPRPAIEVENIQQLRGRTIRVTEGKLEQLVDGNHLTLGEFRVFAELNVLCEDCGTQHDVEELLRRGSCDCVVDAD